MVRITPLIEAAKDGDLEALKTLLRESSTPATVESQQQQEQQRNEDGSAISDRQVELCFALWGATTNGYFECARALVCNPTHNNCATSAIEHQHVSL